MKKRYIGYAFVIATGSALLATGVHSNPTVATEESPIVQLVEHHDEVLDNHEARITNAEADINDLQTNTNTPPSVRRVEVPIVTPLPEPTPDPEPEPEPSPEPQPQPIVVTTSTQRQAEEGKFYCDLTYSDGSKESVFMGQSISFTGQPTMPDKCYQFIGKAK